MNDQTGIGTLPNPPNVLRQAVLLRRSTRAAPRHDGKWLRCRQSGLVTNRQSAFRERRVREEWFAAIGCGSRWAMLGRECSSWLAFPALDQGQSSGVAATPAETGLSSTYAGPRKGTSRRQGHLHDYRGVAQEVHPSEGSQRGRN